MDLPAGALSRIRELHLLPLPNEGGHFARYWTSEREDGNGRPAGTSIYFLITREGFSALHRLDADEVWTHVDGDLVEHAQIHPDGRCERTVLGRGNTSALVAKAGSWQGARLAGAEATWALFTCTMVPGWDEQRFELGKRGELLARFAPSLDTEPSVSELIKSLTRE